MPDPETVGIGPQYGKTREHRAHGSLEQSGPVPKALLHFCKSLLLVFHDFGHRRPYHGARSRRKNPVAFARRDRNTVGALAQTKPSGEPSIYRREVGPGDMIAVADEIVRGQFPIAGNHPLVHAANDLYPALTAVEKGS